MGAWGYGSFENDDSLDWLADLELANDIQILEDTLAAADGADYLEISDASNAVAAAEVVAALAGLPAADLPSTAARWSTTHSTTNLDPLITLAARVINRVRYDSELAEMWVEVGAD